MSGQNFLFEHFSPTGGLSQGSGYAITNYDSFMWFGTQDGLNRFDGYSYKVYKANPTDGLRDNFIQCLLADRQGRFWVGTVRGLDLYEPGKDQFRPVGSAYPVLVNSSINKLAIRRMMEDGQGFVWIMTDEQGLYRLDPRTGKLDGYLQANNSLTDLTVAPNGTVWIIADDELYVFDPATNKVQPTAIKQLLELPRATILRAIVSDARGNLWVGTYEQGVYVIRPRGPSQPFLPHEVVHYQKRTGQNGLSGNEISSLFKDVKGRIWVGTRTAGISIFNPLTGTFAHLTNQENNSRSLASNYVLCFFQDRQGIVWAGLSGEGIDKFDPRKAPFELIRRDPGLPPTQTLADNMAFKLLLKADNLYVGTQSGGLTVRSLLSGVTRTYLPEPGNSASILHNQVHDIVADTAQNLWLATGRGLCVFSTKTRQFTSYLQAFQPTLLYLYAANLVNNGRELWAGGQRGLYRFDLRQRRWLTWASLPALEAISGYVVRLIFIDSAQKLWLGTLGHGLICYDPAAGSVTFFGPKNGLTCANIRSLNEAGNTLWVGTDCGLYALNKQTQTLKSPVTEQQGLPNNVIYGILTESTNALWLSSNKGLTQYFSASGQLKNYRVNDGLQSDEFNTNAACQQADGTLFFGGVKGITYFKANRLVTNHYVPPVGITGIKVLDSLYATNQEEIRLTNKQNFIDFTFVAFNFSNTEKNSYRYRLDGINTGWVDAGTCNFASYTNLPSGTYEFRVLGSNDDGVENPEEAKIRVVILPVFYETTWFRLLLGLLGTSLLVIAYRNYMSFQTVKVKLEKEEAIRYQKEAELNETSARFKQRIAETEMAALRAQMNPHFIFNCLNSIQFFAANNDSEKASEYLTKFSRLIRLVLENSRSNKVTLRNELETLRLFLEMETMRYGEKLRYVIKVDYDVDTDELQIPPLLLQPFVENAIWHGLMHKEAGGTVSLSVSQPKPDQLSIEICDDGVGRAKAAEYKSKSATRQKSFGVQLTAERIQLINQLYQMYTQVVVDDLVDEHNQPAGTRVRLKIPV